MALIDTILQKGHSCYEKYHLTKMAININGTWQEWHLKKMTSQKYGISKPTLLIFSSTTNTLPIEPTPTFRHKLDILDFKRPWPWVWIILQISEFPLKNLSAPPLADNIWAFFRMVCHFCKAPILACVVYAYFTWSICHVPFL